MKVNKNIANERATLRMEQNRLAIEHIKKDKNKTVIKSKDTYTKSLQPRYFNYTKKDTQKIIPVKQPIRLKRTNTTALS